MAATLDFTFRLMALAEMYQGPGPDLSRLGPTDPEWLVVVGGVLGIRADGELVFEQVDFPVADLVRQLGRWQETGMPAGVPFDFATDLHMEEQGVLTFQREGEAWRIRSLWEAVPGGALVEPDAFERAVAGFVAAAREAIQAAWGVDAMALGGRGEDLIHDARLGA